MWAGVYECGLSWVLLCGSIYVYMLVCILCAVLILLFTSVDLDYFGCGHCHSHHYYSCQLVTEVCVCIHV